TLQPLAQACAVPLEDVHGEHCENEAHWQALLQARTAALLAVGTSDSPRGRRIESAARRAAHTLGLPILAIEDFPGNYFPVADGEATLVLVESDAARDLYLRKLGASAPPVDVLSPARYDVHRARLAELREATRASWCRHDEAHAAPRVLWAGQPETDDCLRTLEAVLPVLRALGAELLFKAHPRDPAYEAGIYRELLGAAAVRYEDVTPSAVPEALARAPRLVVTQFSSVAIEAGFYGIPGLCVLLPEAGGARLYEKKSYSVPPFCRAGALLFGTRADELESVLTQALMVESSRGDTLRSFDRYFEVNALKTPALLRIAQRLRAS
ncbi:MAG: hypothetical protein ACXW20_20285, partial [Burkholderiales bacterium]